MATINEVLALAEKLRERVATKKDLQAAKQASNAKIDRLNVEIGSVNAQIDSIKTELRAAVAAME